MNISFHDTAVMVDTAGEDNKLKLNISNIILINNSSTRVAKAVHAREAYPYKYGFALLITLCTFN